jgi:predicted metalloprotease with PDZ domain
MIESLQNTPGRLAQAAGMASYDAWIKFYRPDENSNNTGISYYTKGAVIGFLLDARIRSATNGGKSLDDVMRLAYERFSGVRGFTDSDFRKTAQDVAGVELQSWFHDAVETTKELNYTPALDFYGLRFKTPEAPKPGATPKSWLGFTTKTENGRLIIATVPRGTPAFDAGFASDDEILAISDYRVLPDQWAQRMEQFHPGEKISLLVSRRGKLIKVDATLAEEPRRKWMLEVKPDATPEQTKQLNSWLELAQHER